MYETKGQFIKSVKGACTTYGYGRGKVIGSFICDRIDEIEPDLEYYSDGYDIDDDRLAETCLTREQLREYGKGKILYGWHITEPKLFDKPRALSEFRTPCIRTIHCRACGYSEIVWHDDEKCFYHECRQPLLTRPPMSWCYVEEFE